MNARFSAALLVLQLIAPALALAQFTLPFGVTESFAGSGMCAFCHQTQQNTLHGNHMIQDGQEISPGSTWQSSLMAHSSMDPLWRAMVAAEGLAHPTRLEEIEDSCIRCHAPMLHEEFHADTTGYVRMEMLDEHWVGTDGVSCTVCHQILPDNLGQDESFNGGFLINDEHLVYGPYPNPLARVMQQDVGFMPVHSPHVDDSALCATCHTLFTDTYDETGAVIARFPEQTPYLEWRNSEYPGTDTQCQDCHMPTSLMPHDISRMPLNYWNPREPFWIHQFVGGNAWMLELLRDHRESIGSYATDEDFDRTIQWTREMLHSAISLEGELEEAGDFLHLHLDLFNACGHKVPTGIPMRRIWLHLRAWGEGGELVFESGALDAQGQIVGLDEGYEPHHDWLLEEGDVAVYEAIMGDAQGQVTQSLHSGAVYLKDNRIPPAGFLASHADYEHTAIFGQALQDPDFNRDEFGAEGGGRDRLHVQLPGVTQRVEARLLYRSLTPALVSHLEGFEAESIQAFLDYYDAQGNDPVEMRRAEWQRTSIGEKEWHPSGLRLEALRPNPFNSRLVFRLQLPAAGPVSVRLFNLQGQLARVLHEGPLPAGRHELLLQDGEAELASGVYMLQALAGGEQVSRRVTLLR